MPVFGFKEDLCGRGCCLSELLRSIAVHSLELGPQDFFVAKGLPTGAHSHHASRAQFAQQSETVEACWDEELVLLDDLGFGREVEAVKSMVNVLVERVQVLALALLGLREHHGGPVL